MTSAACASTRGSRPGRRRRAALSRVDRWETLGGRGSGLECLEQRLPLAADLGIAIDAAQVWYMPGTQITSTVTVRNTSQEPATGASVATVLGSQFTRSTWTAVYSAGASGPVAGAGNVAGSITLPAGGTATFTVVSTIGPTATGSLTNLARVTLAGDPNAANDSATSALTQVPRSIVASDAAGWTSTSAVRVLDPESGAERTRFFAYEQEYRGGVKTILADLEGKGRPVIVTAPGRGRVGEIRVFSLDGTELPASRSLPFGADWHGGVDIDVGDVDGDGRLDLAAAKASGDGEVRIFRGQAGVDPIADDAFRSVRPFFPTFLGGATVALADLGTFANGAVVDAALPDGRAELLIGSGPTLDAEVQVRDVSTPAAATVATVRPLASAPLGGVSVRAARVNPDSVPDIIVAAGRRGGGRIEVYDGRVGPQAATRLAAFAAFPGQRPGFAAASVTAADADGDGRADAIYAARPGQGVRRFSTAGVQQGTGPAADRVIAPVAATNRDMITTPSGLQYRNLVVGTGAKPSSPTATVRVNYEGRLLDGTRFDGNNGTSFGLSDVIAGWTEGLAGMRVGGRRQFVIPPNLAYGSQARPNIPANSTLVFDVELLSTN